MSHIIERRGVQVDLSYEHKQACPRCVSEGRDRSKNNLHVYGLNSDGRYLGAKCFACQYTIPSEDWLEENGHVVEEEYDQVGSFFDDTVHARLKTQTGLDPKGYRGIRPEVSKYFGVRYQYAETDGSITSTFYPITKDYELSGYKIRRHPKDFTNPLGETGKECNLFGQFRFKTNTGICLIVGGEHDVLAAYQMLSDNQKDKRYDAIAVVSSTVGEASTAVQIQSNYEFFTQFKKIVIALDADAAGKIATQKVVDVLPAGKAHIMTMRLKDPNEYVKQGRESEFISDFWAARPYTPDGVKSAADAFEEVPEELLKPRITLPHYMHKMQDMMGGGIIQGRILNIIGDTSTGKSTHINRLVYHWIFNSPVTPTIVSLEATAAQYILEMMSVHIEKNLLWSMSGEQIMEYLKTDEGQQAKNELCFRPDGTPRFYIIDDRKGSIKDLESQIELLYRKHGSRLFVIDVLTDMLRGSSEQYAEDHMNFQKNMVKQGVTFANVMHTRKPPQSPDGKMRKVTEYDALGTGSFVQSAAYNIVVNRDKLAENSLEKNTTEVDLPKCRGGKTGPAGKWFYEFNTSQCHDLDEYLAKHPDRASF